MTVRQICMTRQWPIMSVSQNGAGSSPWVRLAAYRPSALLGGANHVTVCHGRIGRSSQPNETHTMQIDILLKGNGGSPAPGATKIHRIFLSGSEPFYTPNLMRGFPFHMIERQVSTTEEIEVFCRLVNVPNGVGAVGLTAVMIENLTLTTFALDNMDDSTPQVRWAYGEGTMSTNVAVSPGNELAAGPFLPNHANDGLDDYAIFWNVDIDPRDAYPATTPGNMDLFEVSIAHRETGGTIIREWGHRGYGARSSPSATTRNRYQIGGSWVEKFDVGEGSNLTAIRGIEQTTTQPGNCTAKGYVLFYVELRNLNHKLVETEDQSYDFYGVPPEHLFEFGGIDIGTPLTIQWEGTQQRHRTAFFDGVGRGLFNPGGVDLSLGSQLRYAFAAGQAPGTFEENRIYAFQSSTAEHTWDCETAHMIEVGGPNSFEAKGQWNPQDLPSFQLIGAGVTGFNVAILRDGQLWTIEQYTGIPTFTIPAPTLGPDLYLVPGREAPSLTALVELPVTPSDTVTFSQDVEQVVLRTDDGEVLNWPRYLKPAVQVGFSFVMDRGTSAGEADYQSLTTFLETQDRAAFKFTPHGEATARPYVFDGKTVRESDLGKKVRGVEFVAYELRWVEV